MTYGEVGGRSKDGPLMSSKPEKALRLAESED
jgi:hypothetical protein